MSDTTASRGSLTPRQNEIYEFIRNRIQQESVPPTIPEIGERFGIRSTNGVNDLLNVLERKGYIIRVRGMARGIVLPKNAPTGAPSGKGMKRIPIVGDGDASNPFSIFMNPHGMLSPDPALFPTANAFAAVVADDGMDKEGIFKGDYVIVSQRTDLGNGDLVFALVGSQQLVRRLQEVAGRRQLLAVNRFYEKIPIREGSDEVALVGEVVGVIRVLKKVEE
jgi:repressor LexA